MTMFVDQLTKDLEDLKAEIRGKNITVVPSNRKLSKYDGSTSVEDWIEEVESALDANSLKDSKAANFIVAALSGQARDEIRGREKATRDDPSLIFTALHSVFGETKRLSQLCQLIYSRRQEQHESLLDFAHALTALVDHLSRKGGWKPSEKGVILRNQFIEGVLDTQLRWELTKKVEANSDFTFIKARELAHQWVSLTGKPDTRRKEASACVSSIELSSEAASDGASQSDMLQQLVKLTEQNQQLLSSLAKRQDDLEASVKKLRRPVCFYCDRPGHVQRNCTKKAQYSSKTGKPPSNGSQVSQQKPLNC